MAHPAESLSPIEERTDRPHVGSDRRLIDRDLIVWAGVFVVVVVVDLIVAWFIRSKGVDLTGDEPSYIIQAQAYLHLHPTILSTIKSDLHAHAMSVYPPGAPVSAVASFPGPHGVISPFEPGLGLLLTPFVATGRLYLGAVVGMVMLDAAGLILIHRRVTHLMGLGRRAQIVFAMLFAAPALLLAMTQIYPDLISGVLLGCGIVEVAIIERTGLVTRCNTVVVAASSAILPWLQVKNFAPAVVILAAFLIVARRARHPWRPLAVVGAVAVVSWVLLLAYNLHYFGHLLGLPEPAPRLSRTGLEYTLGLVFDRNQGIFVQMPFAVLGLVGLWLARKRLPVAVVATVVGAGAILVLNGTYIANPYGGVSFAGRFMWTLIPVMIVWAAVVLARWQEAGRLFWAPAIVIALTWLYQAKPIIAGEHTYYNTPAPWDPASWPGWWQGFSSVLPQFDQIGRPFGAPGYGLLVELGILAIVVIAACEYMRPARFSTGSVVAMVGLGVLVVVALVVAKPLLPSSTLGYDGQAVGAPVAGATGPATSPDVTLQGVLPGRYRFSLSYALVGSPGSSSWVIACNAASGVAPQLVTTALQSGQTTKTVEIQCDQSGTVSTQFHAAEHSTISVGSLRLQKIAV